MLDVRCSYDGEWLKDYRTLQCMERWEWLGGMGALICGGLMGE